MSFEGVFADTKKFKATVRTECDRFLSLVTHCLFKGVTVMHITIAAKKQSKNPLNNPLSSHITALFVHCRRTPPKMPQELTSKTTDGDHRLIFLCSLPHDPNPLWTFLIADGNRRYFTNVDGLKLQQTTEQQQLTIINIDNGSRGLGPPKDRR